MSDNKKNDDLDYETTGHEWDGIKEYNKPLPKWWLWTFYATIVWAVGYSIAYPAWPGISGATPGLLGFSTRMNVEKAIEDHTAELGPINQKLASTELTEISQDPELLTYANNAGAAVFRSWCAQCHGSGAAGSSQAGWAPGYPNLLDDDWLWGGSIEDIHTTITHGIRQQADADGDYLRQSEMPAFGRDELLAEEEVVQVVNYVLQMSGQAPQDAEAAAAGEEVFAANCSGCHGEDGKGDRLQGAPNLTDAIWLYGGGYDQVYESVYNARAGAMPAWGERLSEAQIRAVASYVHGLGGGEATE
ncbi:cytochrome-c oxidase, cbb3-type subunit III [Maliponia aquimaris]|uniref:Cbb3-type cytochrome c oxidase subunit n=1 Tax=Maliponia aquimaris TaxID=1673631 RepID=A0A238KXD4_9RHOB|nr:cytochrome-c oxidase, cbb3-type subunit III [Maliponia aquimaris]SMX47475.1 Cbb3-type cytochrome c oxidase subunit CcoP [Maliponia aquimaris]